MTTDLEMAKVMLSLAKANSTNNEVVLGEIITQSRLKKGISPPELSHKITEKLKMNVGLYRKTIHELYKTETILKIDGLVYCNPKYIKL